MTGYPVHDGICLGCGSGILESTGEHVRDDLHPCFGEQQTPFVTTHKKRFVHLAREDGTNTICSAQPHYYGGMLGVSMNVIARDSSRRGFRPPPSLVAVSEAEAEDMHHCKRCFPKDDQ